MSDHLLTEAKDTDNSSPLTTEGAVSPAAPDQEITDTTNPAVYQVLIVDDNPSFLKLLTLTLSMQPQIGTIDFAVSGESAIKQAIAANYDIIFLDAMMPGMDGYQTCALLRKYEKYKETPIIMVTGLTSPLDEAKAIIAGSTTYVTKPVQQLAFKETLRRVIYLIEYKKRIAQQLT